MGREGPDGRVRICSEGTGATAGFQAEGRQRSVLRQRRGLNGQFRGPPALAPGGMRPMGLGWEGSRVHCQQKPQGTGFLSDVNVKVTQIPGLFSGAT